MYKVIIIEDDPMVAEINRGCLESCPSVELSGIFENGKDAIDYLSSGHTADLVLLDYYMPVMDGRQFLMELRSLNITASVIMVTTASNAQNVRELHEFGLIDYLIKPYSSERLRAAVERFVKFRSGFDTQNRLSQSDLDAITGASPAASEAYIDKGINKVTLNMIIGFLQENTDTALSVEAISNSVSLSKVTVRHYMNYLTEMGRVERKIDYNTGGRPSTLYIYN